MLILKILLIIAIVLVVGFFATLVFCCFIISSRCQQEIMLRSANEDIHCETCGVNFFFEHKYVLTKHKDTYQIVCPNCHNIITIYYDDTE